MTGRPTGEQPVDLAIWVISELVFLEQMTTQLHKRDRRRGHIVLALAGLYLLTLVVGAVAGFTS